MAIDTQVPISRRGLLAAALGGVAAAAAGTITTAQRVFAAGSDGETVVIGDDYPDVRTTTTFRRDLNGPIVRFHDGADDDVKIGAHGVTVHSDDLFGKATSTTSVGAGTVAMVNNGGAEVSVGVRGISSNRSIEISAAGHDTAVAAKGNKTAIEGIGGNVGLIGGSKDGRGVRGWGDRGGHFSGTEAQVRLQPSGRATHPNKGRKGDLFVDRAARLWFCKGGRNWKRMA